MKTVLDLIKKELIKAAHDCSKGGLAIAVSELCMMNKIGCNISIEKVPGQKLADDKILFSESHSRYLLVVEKKVLNKVQSILGKKMICYNLIGKFGGNRIIFQKGSKHIANLSVDKAHETWMSSLRELIVHG